MPSYTNRPGSTKPWGPRRKGLLSAVLSYDSRDNDASAGWLGLPASMWKSLALALGFLLFIWIVGGINWAPPEHAQSLARAQFERKRRRDAGKGVHRIIRDALRAREGASQDGAAPAPTAVPVAAPRQREKQKEL